jgi:import inner membrane translocase subunit TIM10
MSFLFGGQPKMSSEQKLAAAETEVDMIADMFNR